MKKRTLSAITFAGILAMTSLVSCGGESPSEATPEVTEEVTATAEVVVEATEMVAEDLPGSEDFAAAGCNACHQVNKKTVGPAIKDIAKAYSENREGLAAFLNGEGEAIVDPAMASVMAPNLEQTKAMSEEERSVLVDYIMSTGN